MKKIFVIFTTFLLVLGLFHVEPKLVEAVSSEQKIEEYVKPDVDYSNIDMDVYNGMTETEQRIVDSILSDTEENQMPKQTRVSEILTTGLKIFSDGTPNWTISGGLAGNDDGPDNRIVRTYDSIIYRVDYGYNGSAPANIVVEATLPRVVGQEGWYTWSKNVLDLLGYNSELSGDNNEIIKITFENVNPGEGMSIKVPLFVNGSMNGETVQPNFKVYVEGNEAAAGNVMRPDIVTISATANVNTSLINSNIASLEKIEYGGYEWYTFLVASEAQLIGNDGKGFEDLASNISYRVSFSGSYTNGTSDSTGINASAFRILDYGIIGENGVNGNYIGIPKITGYSGGSEYVGKKDLEIRTYATIFDSGTLEDAGPIGMSVSKSFIDFTFNDFVNDKHNAETSRGKQGKIPFVTAGAIVAVRGKALGNNTSYNIKINATVGAVTSGVTVSGQSVVGHNYLNDDNVRSGEGFIRRGSGGRVIYPYIHPSMNNQLNAENLTGSSVASIGEYMRVFLLDSNSMGTRSFKSTSQILHFDPKAYEVMGEYFYGKSSAVYSEYSYAVLGGNTSPTFLNEWFPDPETPANKVYYGVSNVYDDATLSSRRGVPTLSNGQTTDGITWYDTLEEANAQVTDPTGLTGLQVCAVRMDLPGISNLDTTKAGIYTNYIFRVRDNSLTRSSKNTGRTFQISQYSIHYYRDDKNTSNANYYSGLGAGEGYPKYVKKEFNADGSAKPGGTHSFSGPGNVIRVTDFIIKISKEVTNLDDTELAAGNVIVPKLDNKVKWKIQPETFGAILPVPGGAPIEIIDTVPKGLEVVESSIVPEPSEFTVNADGTTTIKWSFTEYLISDELPELSYVTEVDRLSTDGKTYTNSVVMNVGDKQVTTDNTIQILDDAVFMLDKKVDNKLVEKDGDFSYTLRYVNKSTAPEDIKIYDIFPYDNDVTVPTVEGVGRLTDFDGTMKLESLTHTVPNSTIYYSYDSDLTYATVDSGTFKTEAEWTADALGFDITKVTAIRIDILQLQKDTIYETQLKFNTEGNSALDKYENNFLLKFNSTNNGQPVEIPLLSNTVTTEVMARELSGTVWFDKDKNGTYEDGELLVTNAPVKLYYYDSVTNELKPYLDSEGNALTTTTDNNGYYEFTNLKPYVYVVVLDVKEYKDIVRELTSKDSGSDDTRDSDAFWQVVDGKEYAIIDVIDTRPVPTVELGNKETYVGVYPNNDAGIIPEADITPVKSTINTEAAVGGMVPYQIKVTNTGDVVLTNVSVDDAFDHPNFEEGSAVFVSVLDNNGTVMTSGFNIVGTKVTVDSLAVDESITVNYTVKVKDSVTDLEVRNTGVVSSTETGEKKTKEVILPIADVDIVKSSSEKVTEKGATIPYQVKITNTGAVKLTELLVNDPFDHINFKPNSANFVSVLDHDGNVMTSGYSVNGVDVVVDELEIGKSFYVNYTAVVNKEVDSTMEVINVASITTKQTKTKPSNKIVIPITDVEIVKSSSVKETEMGATIPYEVKITNTGKVELTKLVVKDPFNHQNFVPNSAKFVSVIGNDGKAMTSGYSVEGSTVTVDKLAIGEVFIVNYTVKVKEEVDNTMEVINVSSVTTKQTKTKPSNKVVIPIKNLPVTGIDYGMMYVLLIGLMLILVTRLVIKKRA